MWSEGNRQRLSKSAEHLPGRQKCWLQAFRGYSEDVSRVFQHLEAFPLLFSAPSGDCSSASTASARSETGHNTQVLFEQMGVEVLEEIPKTPHRMAGVTNVASWDRCSACIWCCSRLFPCVYQIEPYYNVTVVDLYTRLQSSGARRLAAVATLRMIQSHCDHRTDTSIANNKHLHWSG